MPGTIYGWLFVACSMKNALLALFIPTSGDGLPCRCVWEFNRDNAAKGQRVVLGGTTIHNTASFVKEVLAFPPAPT
jgi:hypothetical protein